MSNKIGGVEVTPELVAELFWNLDAEEQAMFFSWLDKNAGTDLCIQMAYACSEIRKLCASGDYSAQNGFQTMLNHAMEFVLDGIDSRTWDSKRDVSNMVKAAKEIPHGQ